MMDDGADEEYDFEFEEEDEGDEQYSGEVGFSGGMKGLSGCVYYGDK